MKKKYQLLSMSVVAIAYDVLTESDPYGADGVWLSQDEVTTKLFGGIGE